MPDDLRQRYAEALIARIKQSVIPDPYMPGMASVFGATEYDLADVALAVRDEEMERRPRHDRGPSGASPDRRRLGACQPGGA